MYAFVAQLIGLALWRLLGQHATVAQLIVGTWGETGAKVTVLTSLLLASSGVALRIWGSSYLHATTVWAADSTSQRLVISGPFRFVRNPLYLGNVLFMAAFTPLSTPPGALLLLFTVVTLSMALARYEENYLRMTFGVAYVEYAAAVPALVPRITPIFGNRSRANLLAGIRAEIFMFGLFAGLLGYLSGSPYALWIWGLGLIVGILAQRWALVTEKT